RASHRVADDRRRRLSPRRSVKPARSGKCVCASSGSSVTTRAVPELRDLNPHMKPRSGADYPCPYGLCGGEGFVLDEEPNSARPCECRVQRITHARSRRLRNQIPDKYRDVAFDREPARTLLAELGTLGSYLRACP